MFVAKWFKTYSIFLAGERPQKVGTWLTKLIVYMFENKVAETVGYFNWNGYFLGAYLFQTKQTNPLDANLVTLFNIAQVVVYI